MGVTALTTMRLWPNGALRRLRSLAPSRGWASEPRVVFLLAALTLAALLVAASQRTNTILASYFLRAQDLPVAFLMLAAFVIIATRRSAASDGGGIADDRRFARMGIIVAGMACALFAVALLGHDLVLRSHALSRDEHMVLFDAQSFMNGRLATRLPPFWAPYADAMNLLFMPPAVEGVGGVSIYRPVNAAFHASFGLLGNAALTNPLLAAVGLVATWQVARQVLPGDRPSQMVAVILYATSTQVMAAAMTSYAMTGHLALNMIWLACFLHGRWYGHAAALVTGFLAVGLHQIMFHPAFAAPIVFVLLVMRRRWGLSAVYAVSYLAMILVWSRYTALPLRELGVTGSSGEVEHRWLHQLGWAIDGLSIEYVWLLAANLVRFFAWQNLLFLPLLIAGAAAAWRSRDRRLLALVAAVLALVFLRLVFRPDQGHGWGYRYLHGQIGVTCIVAAAGWRYLRTRGVLQPKYLTVATAISLSVVTPWLLLQAHHFSGLFARADRAISASSADVVVLDEASAFFTADLVYNPPGLDRGPVRLLGRKLDAAEIIELCRTRSVGFVQGPDLAPIAREFGQAPRTRDQGFVPPLREAAIAAGCDIRPVPFGA